MIFVEEQIRAVDRHLKALRPNRRIEPGVFEIRNVSWQVKLITAEGEHVASVFCKLPAAEVCDKSVEYEEIAKKVLVVLGKRIAQLKEALRLATQ